MDFAVISSPASQFAHLRQGKQKISSGKILELYFHEDGETQLSYIARRKFTPVSHEADDSSSDESDFSPHNFYHEDHFGLDYLSFDSSVESESEDDGDVDVAPPPITNSSVGTSVAQTDSQLETLADSQAQESSLALIGKGQYNSTTYHREWGQMMYMAKNGKLPANTAAQWKTRSNRLDLFKMFIENGKDLQLVLVHVYTSTLVY